MSKQTAEEERDILQHYVEQYEYRHCKDSYYEHLINCDCLNYEEIKGDDINDKTKQRLF